MFSMYRASEAGAGVFTGGQPGQADLQMIAADGVRRVVDLRAPAENRGFDERHEVEHMQIEYCALPVKDESDLTRPNVDTLDWLLQGAAERPTLIHCASGNRVGALLALRAGWISRHAARGRAGARPSRGTARSRTSGA